MRTASAPPLPDAPTTAGAAGTGALTPLRFATALADARRRPRESVVSAITSLLIHTLLIALLWLGQDHLRQLAGELGVGTGIGPGLAGGGGGGGSEGEQYAWIEIPEPPPPAPEPMAVAELIPEIPTPEPVIEAPDLTTVLKDALAQGLVPADSGRGTGAGGGIGPGQGPGTGPGSGGGTGGGSGGGIGSGIGPGTGRGRLLAPSPNTILIPPQAPSAVKGRTVLVRLAVDSAGIVREVELVPSTGDRKYDEKLRKTAFGWRFRPARDAANRPVAAPFEFEYTF